MYSHQETLLEKMDRQKRLGAKTANNWTLKDWQNVLWPDESKFELFSSKRRVYEKERLNNKCVVPSNS